MRRPALSLCAPLAVLLVSSCTKQEPPPQASDTGDSAPVETPMGNPPASPPPTEPAADAMVRIEGGVFKGQKLSTFHIDRTEVTVESYARCVAAKACREPADTGNKSSTWGKPGKERHPVNEVDWKDAKDYCRWAGKELPTELQWEWAARGRDEARVYPWGSGAPDSKNACWNRFHPDKNLSLGPCPVATFPPTRDGVYDMAGNLWEWTADHFAEGDPGVVLRGGAWYNDDTEKLKTAFRAKNSPEHRGDASDGIRCVKNDNSAASDTTAAPAPTPPAPTKAGCLRNEDCGAGETCEGQGCTDDAPGICQPGKRMCTRDLRVYCGCDGKEFRTSGSCPGRRYKNKGPCTQ